MTLSDLKFLRDPNSTSHRHIASVKNQQHAQFERVGDRLAVSYPVSIYSYQHGGMVHWCERQFIDGFIVDSNAAWATESRTSPCATLTRGAFIFERAREGAEFWLTVRSSQRGSKVRRIEQLVLEKSVLQNGGFAKIDLCTVRDLIGKLHLLVLAPVGPNDYSVTSFSSL